MNTASVRYFVPACAVIVSLFCVAILQFTLGLFFEALGSQEAVLPGIARLAWGIHNWRWLILLAGSAALAVACGRNQSEKWVNIFSSLYMLGWVVLCFLIQFSLVYALNHR